MVEDYYTSNQFVRKVQTLSCAEPRDYRHKTVTKLMRKICCNTFVFQLHLQSIEFHEKGKRHKENAAKRLSEIGKKSRQEHQKNLKVDAEMKKMEEVWLRHSNIT